MPRNGPGHDSTSFASYRFLSRQYNSCTFMVCYIPDLDSKALQLVQDGLRSNTKKAYSSAQRCYQAFCIQYSLPLLPATEEQLLRFIVHCKNNTLAPSTIQVYLAAVVSLHQINGYAPPPSSSYRVKLAIRAINSHSPPPSSRHPITYKILSAMLLRLQKDHQCLLWSSMLTLGFYGALRGVEYSGTVGASGTIQAPLVKQIEFHAHRDTWAFVFTIPKTKTTNHPVSVPIGCSGTPVCAVCLMIQYLSSRHISDSLHPSSFLFTDSSGRPVTKYQYNQVIKLLVKQIGLNPSHYTTHSLRSGSATAASVAGFTHTEIQQLGHWTSSAYVAYVAQNNQHRYDFASRLASYHK